MTKSLLFTGVILWMWAEQLIGMPNIRYQGIEGMNLEVMLSDRPDFHKLLESSISASAKQTLKPILPFSVLLKNNTDLPISLISLRWEIRNLKQQLIPQTMTLLSFTNDSRSLLMPGEYAFMAPKAGLNRKLSPNSFASLSSANLGWGAEQLFKVQAEISIRLDAVGFSDGTCRGLDLGMNLLKVNAYLQSESEIMRELLDSSARSSDALRQILLKHSRKLEDVALTETDKAKLIMEEERYHLTQRLLRVLDTSGPTELLQVCTATLAAPKIKKFRI